MRLDDAVEYDFAGRLAIYDWQVVVAIVVIAWVLRFGLGKLESLTRFLALAFLGARGGRWPTPWMPRQAGFSG